MKSKLGGDGRTYCSAACYIEYSDPSSKEVQSQQSKIQPHARLGCRWTKLFDNLYDTPSAKLWRRLQNFTIHTKDSSNRSISKRKIFHRRLQLSNKRRCTKTHEKQIRQHRLGLSVFKIIKKIRQRTAGNGNQKRTGRSFKDICTRHRPHGS